MRREGTSLKIKFCNLTESQSGIGPIKLLRNLENDDDDDDDEESVHENHRRGYARRYFPKNHRGAEKWC